MLTKGLRGGAGGIEILPRVLEQQLLGASGLCHRGTVHRGRVGGPQANQCDSGRSRSGGGGQAGGVDAHYYHVWPDTDLIGVEVCAAMKNFYALGVGMATGMLESSPAVEARMNDPAAALFAEALWEMSYLVGMLGGKQRSVWTLAGAGDLYVTCQAGRNSRMGRWLGLGLPYSQAKARHMSEETVEGAETARAIGPAVDALIAAEKLDAAALPLMRAILDAVCRDMPAVIPWQRFFNSKCPVTAA